MDKRAITCEEMKTAYLSGQPIDGKWDVTNMQVRMGIALPKAPMPNPNEIVFNENGMLIAFTVRKKHE